MTVSSSAHGTPVPANVPADVPSPKIDEAHNMYSVTEPSFFELLVHIYITSIRIPTLNTHHHRHDAPTHTVLLSEIHYLMSKPSLLRQAL